MLLTTLLCLTILGFILLAWSFITDRTSWKFISFGFLFVLYFMGWQHLGHNIAVREETEHIYDYQFQKTNDYHVVLYIPRERSVYIRDEAEFYNNVDDCNKPLLTRTRSYDMYDNIMEEDLVVTPLLPTVSIVAKSDTVTIVATVKVVAKPPVVKERKVVKVKVTTVKLKAKKAAVTKVKYPYVVLDNGERKNVRITARSNVKRFLRSSVEQVVLVSAKGETYAIRYEKNGEYQVASIKATYNVQKEIKTLYEVYMDKNFANTIKEAN